MKILLTNDDGYDAPGILSLFNILNTSHDVILIAPDRENSAVGHGITLNAPLRIKSIRDQLNCYSVNGTPVDCIKLGLFEFFKSSPDLVISGINNGSNLGVDINYSGTVAAAREAAVIGIPSLAVSIPQGEEQDYKGVSFFIDQFINSNLVDKIPGGTFLNINAPGVPVSSNIQVKNTCLAQNNLSNQFEKKKDPKNRPYYWYGNVEQSKTEPGTDVFEVNQNHISITLIQCNMTADPTALNFRDRP